MEIREIHAVLLVPVSTRENLVASTRFRMTTVPRILALARERASGPPTIARTRRLVAPEIDGSCYLRMYVYHARKMRVADYDGFRSTGWIVCLCNFKNKCDAWKSMQLVELSGFLFFNTFHPRVDIYAPIFIYGTLFLKLYKIFSTRTKFEIFSFSKYIVGTIIFWLIYLRSNKINN